MPDPGAQLWPVLAWRIGFPALACAVVGVIWTLDGKEAGPGLAGLGFAAIALVGWMGLRDWKASKDREERRVERAERRGRVDDPPAV